MLLFFHVYPIFNLFNFVVQDSYFLDFEAVESRLHFYRVEQAIFVEAMHAGKYVEFRAEQSLEALLTFMGRVDFDASIFNHTQLIFKLVGIG